MKQKLLLMLVAVGMSVGVAKSFTFTNLPSSNVFSDKARQAITANLNILSNHVIAVSNQLSGVTIQAGVYTNGVASVTTFTKAFSSNTVAVVVSGLGNYVTTVTTTNFTACVTNGSGNCYIAIKY